MTKLLMKSMSALFFLLATISFFIKGQPELGPIYFMLVAVYFQIVYMEQVDK